MIRLIVATMALLIGTAVAGIGYTLHGVGRSHVLGPGTVTIELDALHSHYSLADAVVQRGTSVRFVIHNRDPIRHEFIVGPKEVHDRHANGKEAAHPPKPGEVTIDPGLTAETTYTFDAVGNVVFACHLPRHFEYGMHGVVRVVSP